MPEAEPESGGKTLGEYLRQAREAKGATLDEACHVTKIGRGYLAAIEQGEFEKLPNPAYIKGFLRLYAHYLGLSGDEVVGRYEQSVLPAAAAPTERPHAEPATIAGVERVKFPSPGRWVVPVLLLGLVIVAAMFLSEGDERKERPVPPPRKAAVPPPVVPPKVAVLPPLSSARPAPAPPAAEKLPAAAPAPGAQVASPRSSGVILRLRFNHDSWLSITIDDSVSQQYDLKAGDVIEWKGAKSFTLDLGDGGAVEGEFNGRPLKSLGERGKPAHVELKAALAGQ